MAEDEEDEPEPNSPLGSVVGFLSVFYALCYTLLNFGIGKKL